MYSLKKSGEMPGGKFAGPSCRIILKEETLKHLEDLLPNKEVAKNFTTFLHKTRELHKMCIGKELGEYEKVIDEFSESFFVLYDKHGVNMPLKTHVIIDHYKFYFEDTGNERHQW